jgi:hypothetical protein
LLCCACVDQQLTSSETVATEYPNETREHPTGQHHEALSHYCDRRGICCARLAGSGT